MSNPVPLGTLEREYLGVRCRLLELAAALDRIARHDGPAAEDDARMIQFRQALEILADREPRKAERVQIVFSLPVEE